MKQQHSAELKEFHRQQSAVIDTIFTKPIDALFIARGQIRDSCEGTDLCVGQCAICGERVVIHRARVRNGTFVCIPCAGEIRQRGVNVNKVLKIRYEDSW